MSLRFLLAVLLATALTAWGNAEPNWPHAGPMPDEAVGVPPSHYSPIASGTKTFRPVEPMPWGDVNKRVAPPDRAPSAPPAKPEQQDMH